MAIPPANAGDDPQAQLQRRRLQQALANFISSAPSIEELLAGAVGAGWTVPPRWSDVERAGR
jgi:hypothetical protein